jgi:hypothetical protein
VGDSSRPPAPRRDSRRCGQPRDVVAVGVAGAPAGAVVQHRRQLHSALGAGPPPRLPRRAWRCSTSRRGLSPASPKIDRRVADFALPSAASLIYKRNQHGGDGEGQVDGAVAAEATDAAGAARGRRATAARRQQPEWPRRPAEGRGAQADAAGAGARSACEAAVPRPTPAGARRLAGDPGGRAAAPSQGVRGGAPRDDRPRAGRAHQLPRRARVDPAAPHPPLVRGRRPHRAGQRCACAVHLDGAPPERAGVRGARPATARARLHRPLPRDDDQQAAAGAPRAGLRAEQLAAPPRGAPRARRTTRAGRSLLERHRVRRLGRARRRAVRVADRLRAAADRRADDLAPTGRAGDAAADAPSLWEVPGPM